jgi:hypothetical protein
MNYLPKLALNLYPPDLCFLSSRITGVSHQRPAQILFFLERRQCGHNFLFHYENLIKKKIKQNRWAPVAHACNPSYPGGRDQEDHGSKPAQANSLGDCILKIPNTRKKKLVE